MKIRVLGSGCSRCEALYAEAQKVIAASGIKVALEEVEEIDEIVKYDVLMTPVLVLDEEVKASGRIPRRSEIVSWITAAAGKASAEAFDRPTDVPREDLEWGRRLPLSR